MKQILRTLAWLWGIAILVCLTLFALISSGPKSTIETDILALLPQINSSPVVNHALKKFTEQVSNQVVLVFEATTFSEARRGAENTLARLRRSGAFTEIVFQQPSGQREAIEELLVPRAEGFITGGLRSMLRGSGALDQILEREENILQTPMTGGATLLLDKDPLLLSLPYFETLGAQATGIVIQDGIITIPRGETVAVVAFAHFSGSAFSRSVQQSVVGALRKAKAELHSESPDIQLTTTGVVEFAESAALTAETEISLIGVGSLIGVVLLTLLPFASLRPLVLMLGTVAVGCLVAFVLTFFVFGSVHMITLGFGASLVGVGVDHGFHFYCHQATAPQKSGVEILRSIFFAILLGILTTILGFLGLLITPFPGLNQMAFFSIVGLTAAFLTVVLFFPFLSKLSPRPGIRPWLLSLGARWISLWREKSLVVHGVLAICLVFILWGWRFVSPNDDVRLLEKGAPELKANELHIRELLGSTGISRFFVVSAPSQDQALLEDLDLTERLNTIAGTPDLRKFNSVSQLYVPEGEQRERSAEVRTFVRENRERLLDELNHLGFSEAAQKRLRDLDTSPYEALPFDEWFGSPASAPVRHLWLGPIDNAFATLVTLDASERFASFNDYKEAAQFTKKWVGQHNGQAVYVDRVRDSSLILKAQRLQAMLWVPLFYGSILIVLCARYGTRQGIIAFAPAAIAALVCVSGNALLGQPMNLFAVLAVIIVLGLSIDYSIFLLEGEDEIEATMMAVILSTLSTVLSLALLALCTSPVLKTFGINLFLGTSTAMLLAPLVVYGKKANAHD